MSRHTPSSILDAADSELGPSCCDEDYQNLRKVMIVAPDLLEALKTIKRRMYEPRALMILEVEALIDEAIAKTRGEE